MVGVPKRIRVLVRVRVRVDRTRRRMPPTVLQDVLEIHPLINLKER
jgi:hypothetical protein